MKENKGQSLVEVVFAIGIILLVISGVTALLLVSVSSRTKSYDRQKAVELSQIVMENLLLEKKTAASDFWNYDSNFWITNRDVNQVNPNFPEYNYKITATQFSDGGGCSNSKLECMNVVVNIGWSGSNSGESFNRFFSNK